LLIGTPSRPTNQSLFRVLEREPDLAVRLAEGAVAGEDSTVVEAHAMIRADGLTVD